MKYEKIIQEFQRAYNRHDSVQSKIAELEAKIEGLRGNYPRPDVNVPLERIARMVRTKLNATGKTHYFQICGPAGIGCTYWVSWYEDRGKNTERDTREDRCVASLAFCKGFEDETEDITLKLRDYSVNTGEFGSNSMGAMNGLNHPLLDIPKDADVDWFLERGKKEEEALDIA